MLAERAVCYDVAADGTVVYSDGAAIHRLTPAGGRERLVVAAGVERVLIL